MNQQRFVRRVAACLCLSAALAAAALTVGPSGCKREPEIKQTPPSDPSTPPPYAGQTTSEGGTSGQAQPAAQPAQTPPPDAGRRR